MQAWLADKLEHWPIERLLPYIRNARTHSEAQIAQIAASIAEFGFTAPILAAQKTNRVARAIELAPSYTDVAVKRFQQNHPDIPVTLLATGQTFAEVEQERQAERLETADATE